MLTYATVTADGALLGCFHSTEAAAIAAAKTIAISRGEPIRIVCYGAAGEVKYFAEAKPR